MFQRACSQPKEGLGTHASLPFMPDLRESTANLALLGYSNCKSAGLSDRLLAIPGYADRVLSKSHHHGSLSNSNTCSVNGF